MNSSLSTAAAPGSVAIVTGAAKRLGRQIALQLAEELGLNIVVHCHSSTAAAEEVAEQIRAFGVKSCVVSADLSDSATTAKKIFEAAATIGTAQVLINSAAIFENATLNEIDAAQFDRHFAINAIAPAMLCQQLVSQLGDQRAHVVNILDWRATRPPADYLAYTASKAALAAVTKTLAQQLAPNVQINAIAPGAMLPPPDQPNWHDERANEAIPLKKTGTPDDICDAVCYLLRSTFVTGEILHVCGGENL